ncbi:hypothetical protein GCK72_025785 [Caenorhabditis remanei]|uniref:Uncharacterized protein n=1 Tax=Caenorhabditis remanei TaxID=31234 RepID=A0A6A5G2W7_CAERE|nr:hypothetical protein GCK72_025785 [Caenorhabditis remanei]KAF1749318.1 hypothetical protein GCK72_025785 [Caenorhabditis remanei]
MSAALAIPLTGMVLYNHVRTSTWRLHLKTFHWTALIANIVLASVIILNLEMLPWCVMFPFDSCDVDSGNCNLKRYMFFGSFLYLSLTFLVSSIERVWAINGFGKYRKSVWYLLYPLQECESDGVSNSELY